MTQDALLEMVSGILFLNHGHQHQDADQHSIQGGLPQQDLVEDGGRQDPLLIGH